jgi:hypothetical protein
VGRSRILEPGEQIRRNERKDREGMRGEGRRGERFNLRNWLI